jgi:tetratricopeptide (TPR) repeat protein
VAERGPAISLAFVVGSLIYLSLAVLTGESLSLVAPLVALIILVSAAYRTLLAWRNLVALMILVILFVPMRRFVLPGSLPFELDLFRLLVAFVLGGWVASLLVDPRVRLRRSGLEAPLLLILATSVASVVANADRVGRSGSEVGKSLSYLLSYFVVFFVIVGVTRKGKHIDFLLKVLVGGAAIVAAAAIVESRTHANIFDQLPSLLPFLRQQEDAALVGDLTRGYRAFGSAQHPIALSAALVLVLPVSIYLVKHLGQRRWWLAAGLLLAGAFASVSRTSVMMLLVVGLVFVWLQPREMKRLWIALIPALFLVHVALPGTLGTIKQSFSPSEGLIEQQSVDIGSSDQGRIADIRPTLERLSEDPLFGVGYATRVAGAPGPDGRILDDQWLGTLLDTGVPGALAWLWLILRSLRRMGHAARQDRSSANWLPTAFAASVAAFAFGMFFFDAFAFIQVTLVFFVLLAFSCVATTRETARSSNEGRAHTDGARAARDREVGAEAALALPYFRLHTAPPLKSYEEVKRELDDAIRAFEEVHDEAGLARGLSRTGIIRFRRGEAAAAIEDFERAARYANNAGDRTQEAESLRGTLLAATFGPIHVESALERIEDVRRKVPGNRRLEVTALATRAWLEAMRGRFDVARELISEAKALADNSRLETMLAGLVLRVAGEIELLGGEPAAAERALRPACEALGRMGDPGYFCGVAPVLADALYDQGRVEEAAPMIELASRLESAEDLSAQVGVRRARAKLLARQGDFEDAERVAREARKLAACTDFLDTHARAIADLADVLHLAGRSKHAAGALEEAIRLHEQKGNVVAAGTLRALLAERLQLGLGREVARLPVRSAGQGAAVSASPANYEPPAVTVLGSVDELTQIQVKKYGDTRGFAYNGESIANAST